MGWEWKSNYKYDEERRINHRLGASLDKRDSEVKHLRQTLTDIVESFSGSPDIQNHIIKTVKENSHDTHLIKRLKRRVDE